jgi:hypothetical protein
MDAPFAVGVGCAVDVDDLTGTAPGVAGPGTTTLVPGVGVGAGALSLVAPSCSVVVRGRAFEVLACAPEFELARFERAALGEEFLSVADCWRLRPDCACCVAGAKNSARMNRATPENGVIL